MALRNPGRASPGAPGLITTRRAGRLALPESCKAIWVPWFLIPAVGIRPLLHAAGCSNPRHRECNEPTSDRASAYSTTRTRWGCAGSLDKCRRDTARLDQSGAGARRVAMKTEGV